MLEEHSECRRCGTELTDDVSRRRGLCSECARETSATEMEK